MAGSTYSIPTPLGPDQAYSAFDSFGPVFLATVIDEHDWDLGLSFWLRLWTVNVNDKQLINSSKIL